MIWEMLQAIIIAAIGIAVGMFLGLLLSGML